MNNSPRSDILKLLATPGSKHKRTFATEHEAKIYFDKLKLELKLLDESRVYNWNKPRSGEKGEL